MDLKKRAKKGQAAIEYLMTYGWALLVIAIVIVVLYMITQTQTKTEMCLAPVGFACNDPLPQFTAPAAGAGDATISVRLHNKQMQTITVSDYSCAKSSDGTGAGTVGTGGSASSGGYVNLLDATCKDLKKGQSFSGYVIVHYNYANDISTTPRVLVVSVSGTAG